MKWFKDNLHIIVSTLLVLSLLTIIINSIYAGYKQHMTMGTKSMYGLMYVSPEGEKEYVSNTSYGSTTEHIEDIAVLTQEKTAYNAAKKLLKGGWLDEVGGEVYVVEVLTVVHNAQIVEKPKPKKGYCISFDRVKNSGVTETLYYSGPMESKYSRNFRENEFTTSITASTAFKTEKKAAATWNSILEGMRKDEKSDDEHLARQKRILSHEHPTHAAFNDHMEQVVRILNYANICK
jgi:hypothetical protein